MYKLKECPTAHVISGILNVVNVVRHYLMVERLKECPTAHVLVQVKRMSDGSCDAEYSQAVSYGGLFFLGCKQGFFCFQVIARKERKSSRLFSE